MRAVCYLALYIDDNSSSHEITNELYVRSNYENTTKTVTADLRKTMMLRRTPHTLKKSKSLVKTVNTTSKVTQLQIANWIRILTEAT